MCSCAASIGVQHQHASSTASACFECTKRALKAQRGTHTVRHSSRLCRLSRCQRRSHAHAQKSATLHSSVRSQAELCITSSGLRRARPVNWHPLAAVNALTAVQVTIDVRAPVRGVLRAVTVQEEDMVTVGQVIAVLDESDAASTAAQASTSQADNSKEQLEPKSVSEQKVRHQPQARQADLDELTDAASRASDSAMRGGKARIQFPPRKTDNGMTISAMPAFDQKTYTARGVAGRGKSNAQTSSQGLPAGQTQGTQPSVSESRVLDAQVPRSIMSDAEMESIMLGGAPP